MSFARVYPLYVAKAERKGRTKAEVDAIICWLTGYNQRGLEGQLKKQKDFETFFRKTDDPLEQKHLLSSKLHCHDVASLRFVP